MKYSNSPYLSELIERNIRKIMLTHNTVDSIKNFLTREIKNFDELIDKLNSDDPQEAAKNQIKLITVIQNYFKDYMMTQSYNQFLSINKNCIVTVKQVTPPKGILSKFIHIQNCFYQKESVQEEKELLFKLLTAKFEEKIYMLDDFVPKDEIIHHNIVLLEDGEKAIVQNITKQESEYASIIRSIIINNKDIFHLFCVITIKQLAMQSISMPEGVSVLDIVKEQTKKKLSQYGQTKSMETSVDFVLSCLNQQHSQLFILKDNQEIAVCHEQIIDEIYTKQFTADMNDIYRKLGIN